MIVGINSRLKINLKRGDRDEEVMNKDKVGKVKEDRFWMQQEQTEKAMSTDYHIHKKTFISSQRIILYSWSTDKQSRLRWKIRKTAVTVDIAIKHISR